MRNEESIHQQYGTAAKSWGPLAVALILLVLSFLGVQTDCGDPTRPPVDVTPGGTLMYISFGYTGGLTQAFQFSIRLPNHADYASWTNWQYQFHVKDGNTSQVYSTNLAQVVPQPERGGEPVTMVLQVNDVQNLAPPSGTDYRLYATVQCDTNGPGHATWQAGPGIDAEGNEAVVTIVRATDGIVLVPYIGEWRYGSDGDTIGWWNSYPLYVQARHEDLGIGVDGVAVSWDVQNPPGAENLVVKEEQTHVVGQWGSPDAIHGVARAHLAFPLGLAEGTIEVTVSAGSEDASFNVYCLGRNDIDVPVGSPGVDFPDPLWEKRGNNVIYPGDGHWAEDYTCSYYKDIYLEVDYDNGLSVFRVESVLACVDTIFKTAGVDSVRAVISAISSPPENMGMQQLKKWLYDTRVDDEYKGLGTGRIHVIMGGSPSPYEFSNGALGVLVCATVGMESRAEAMHHASTGYDEELDLPLTNPYLDSTGCFVWTGAFEDPWPSYWTMTWVQAAAICLAHEVGHAIGLHHGTTEGVMSSSFNPQYDEYSESNYFGEVNNDDDYWHKLINLRQSVGREAIEPLT